MIIILSHEKSGMDKPATLEACKVIGERLVTMNVKRHAISPCRVFPAIKTLYFAPDPFMIPIICEWTENPAKPHIKDIIDSFTFIG